VAFPAVWRRLVAEDASNPRCSYALKLIMPEPTVRERILQALENLPPDATFDDAIERLVFLAKIDAGLAELDAGEGVPHDEVKRRLGL
jgi:hypothetical protein